MKSEDQYYVFGHHYYIWVVLNVTVSAFGISVVTLLLGQG